MSRTYDRSAANRTLLRSRETETAPEAAAASTAPAGGSSGPGDDALGSIPSIISRRARWVGARIRNRG
ncbi:hypothetical protein [Mangrovactinospora gilvigrisea]|nr:hypothetical protein [Mangrovactinospora gilvigrisea]